MIKILFLISFILCSQLKSQTIENFLNEHSKAYQDIIVNGKVILNGIRICDKRYDLIKPILEELKYPFSVLDIGAAQGYFDFRILHEFPSSFCLMIEGDIYPGFTDTLKQICALNENKNVHLIDKRISVEELASLNDSYHFDVILAFTVLHQFARDIYQRIDVIEILKKLGNNIIIEVPNNVDIDFYNYMDILYKNHRCKYLGEVKRNKNPECLLTSKFYLFKGYTQE